MVTIKRCQSSGLIMVNDGGQLANQLSAYASLLAASIFVNATPVISYNIRSKLITTFPYVTIPVLYPNPCPKTINWTHVEIEEIKNLTNPISKYILSESTKKIVQEAISNSEQKIISVDSL